jgi:hypothetical protein
MKKKERQSRNFKRNTNRSSISKTGTHYKTQENPTRKKTGKEN